MRRVSLNIGLLLLAFAVIAATGCRKKAADDTADAPDSGPSAPVAVEIARATAEPMQTVVSAQGTLVAAQGASVKVAPAVAGRLREVLVKEGDQVRAGQLLALLDSRPQQAQAASAEAALLASQTQARQAGIAADAAAADQRSAVRQAVMQADSARLDRSASVTNARNALDAALTDLKKTRAGSRPQEIAAAESAVTKARAAQERASTELTRARFLVSKGIWAQHQLDDAQTAASSANADLDAATQQASLVRAGARPEDLRAAELRVEGARAALSQAKSSGDAKVALAQADLRRTRQGAAQVTVHRQEAIAAQQTAQQKQEDYAAASATASYAEIRSPINGVVAHRSANAGDVADPTVPMMEIVQSAKLNLLAELPAGEGTQVREGQSAIVHTEDAPGIQFAGRVLSVGAVDPSSNLLPVRMTVNDPAGKLRLGEYATADIIVRSVPRAITVPRQAVISGDSGPVVFTVDSNSVAHQKAVTLGPQRGDRVQVTSGISAGDQVIRLGQYELTDGAKVKNAAESADKAADSAAPAKGEAP